jgi:hypothetical protein
LARNGKVTASHDRNRHADTMIDLVVDDWLSTKAAAFATKLVGSSERVGNSLDNSTA